MTSDPTADPRRLDGRRVVVTGATSGIGERTAYNLADMGAEILVVGRNPPRCRSVAEQIRHRGGLSESFVADLTDRAAVRALAAALASRYPAIHVLVNNAGAIVQRRTETVDGAERTFALNVEAPFMLTELLLPSLVKSEQGRVVNVASSAHRTGRMHFDDLDLHRGYSSWRAYGQSKLALVLLTREAARIHRGLPVTFNACHPGFIRSRFGSEGTGVSAHLFRAVQRLGGRSVEYGARAPTFLSSAGELDQVSGAYFRGTERTLPSRRARRAEDAHRLWQLMEGRTGVSVTRPTDLPGRLT